MAELKTTEKYALAQILVCGAIDKEEFKSVNEFLGAVQNDTLRGLRQKGVFDHTLFQDNER